ncbi:MAG TPA: hypothetical protein VFG85_06960 [Gaiellaceae bacterium]|jgi:hypothetical protein|nr:hypothetical protein [Gaiellaceae bacterium]
MTTLASALEAPYRPRHVRFIRREDVEGWQLKLYGIAVNGQEPRPEFVEATRDLAAQVLPQPPAGEDRYGVGFAIAHDARSVGIALVYFWKSENELHQRIYVSPKDDPAAFTQVENQPAGCVWELEVVNFERLAWLEDVLSNPAGPDLDAYLERSFSRDV